MNNLFYFLGALLVLAILGYAYLILVRANKEKGVTRIAGQVLSGLMVLVLLLLVVFYKTGVLEMPRFMPERPTARIMRGMSGYVVGMMVDDERTIDEFINSLQTNPELYDKFKEKLK